MTEKISMSRSAVVKWETGNSMPDINSLLSRNCHSKPMKTGTDIRFPLFRCARRAHIVLLVSCSVTKLQFSLVLGVSESKIVTIVSLCF